jgi:hypothetical protein
MMNEEYLLRSKKTETQLGFRGLRLFGAFLPRTPKGGFEGIVPFRMD